MKTTNKEYQAKIQERKDLNSLKFEARQYEDWNMVQECENSIRLLNENFFNLLETTAVSFMVGGRLFYENVVKIGKTYFNNGTKMNKTDGCYCITEIDEITEEMNQEMIADSYYY